MEFCKPCPMVKHSVYCKVEFSLKKNVVLGQGNESLGPLPGHDGQFKIVKMIKIFKNTSIDLMS